MRLTNRDIFSSQQAMVALCLVPFPVTVSFSLAKMARAMNEPLFAIDKVRVDLVEKHGERDEDTEQWKVQQGDPGFAAFMQAFEELLNIEVDVDFEKVAIPQQIGGKDIEIAPQVLIALEKFIDIEWVHDDEGRLVSLHDLVGAQQEASA